MLDVLSAVGAAVARFAWALLALLGVVRSYFMLRDAIRTDDEDRPRVPRDPLSPATERALAEAEERRANLAKDR